MLKIACCHYFDIDIYICYRWPAATILTFTFAHAKDSLLLLFWHLQIPVMASSLVMFRSMVWVGHNTNLQSMQAINTIRGVLYKSERLLWIVHSCWCFISTVEQVCITRFINTVLHSLYSPEDHSILYAVCGDIVFDFVLVLLMSSLMFWHIHWMSFSQLSD